VSQLIDPPHRREPEGEQAQSASDGAQGRRRPWDFLRPPPPAPLIDDPETIRATYGFWRPRILITATFAYAVFYLVRKNLGGAIPAMEEDLGIDKESLGLFLTLHGVMYGVSKFFNGFVGDRSNARYFMALGLVLSAACNVAFGLSSAVVAMGSFWVLNGWVQGMGFPPCARTLSHWFSPSERPTMFGIWNTSHSIGAAGASALTGFLVVRYGWRPCFLVPAGIAVVGAVAVRHFMRDTPASLGLPEIEEFKGDTRKVDAVEEVETLDAATVVGEPLAQREFVLRHVLSNPLVWFVSTANFFVYVVRQVIYDWGPSYLYEAKGIALDHANFMVALFEIGGVAGAVLGGIATDRYFRSHAGRVCVGYMAACAALVFAFWKLESNSIALNAALLAGIGFFIYGPQCLVGVIAANLGTKRATATAIGLTGLFGYASTVLSGWGFGRLVKSRGWADGLGLVFGCSIAALFLFVLVWNVSAETELKIQEKGNRPRS
jgi:OPA family glycerol-3-phosphate transporter-like MFS transporter/OPA family sugar phosphate sensor protein UhpC-like MFS transporter